MELNDWVEIIDGQWEGDKGQIIGKTKDGLWLVQLIYPPHGTIIVIAEEALKPYNSPRTGEEEGGE